MEVCKDVDWGDEQTMEEYDQFKTELSNKSAAVLKMKLALESATVELDTLEATKENFDSWCSDIKQRCDSMNIADKHVIEVCTFPFF